jgi:hypothetical protein
LGRCDLRLAGCAECRVRSLWPSDQSSDNFTVRQTIGAPDCTAFAANESAKFLPIRAADQCAVHTAIRTTFLSTNLLPDNSTIVYAIFAAIVASLVCAEFLSISGANCSADHVAICAAIGATVRAAKRHTIQPPDCSADIATVLPADLSAEFLSDHKAHNAAKFSTHLLPQWATL